MCRDNRPTQINSLCACVGVCVRVYQCVSICACRPTHTPMWVHLVVCTLGLYTCAGARTIVLVGASGVNGFVCVTTFVVACLCMC